jgi:hypothetical protein
MLECAPAALNSKKGVPMFVSNYNLTHLFSYTATVRLPPEVIGPVPEGIRANFYVTSTSAR